MEQAEHSLVHLMVAANLCELLDRPAMESPWLTEMRKKAAEAAHFEEK